jgi:hypothetical protein
VRKVVTAVLADHSKVVSFRAQGMSWSEVEAQFSGNPAVKFTSEQADAWHKNGFAIWVGHRRMLITARFKTRLCDLSATARFDEDVLTNHKEEWIGPYLRGRFLKPECR